jgi:hypothetical protein
LESTGFPAPITVANLHQHTARVIEHVFATGRVLLILWPDPGGIVGQIEPCTGSFSLSSTAYAVITIQQLHEGLTGFLERLVDGARLVVVRDTYPNDKPLATISHTSEREVEFTLAVQPTWISRASSPTVQAKPARQRWTSSTGLH